VYVSELSLRYERGIDMKKHIVLSMLLVVTCVLFGQEKRGENRVSKPRPAWVREGRMAAGSNYVDTFAQAFKDPNILIGVFEYPSGPARNTLSSGEILEDSPGYLEAAIRFNLKMLRCIKPIKGQSPEPVVLVPRLFPPILEARPRIPAFIPLAGSKWVLALKKTSKEYRIARFGENIEKYKFINDRTMFMVFRYGHGALCLKWADVKKPSHVVKVPESIVDDFEAIQRVIPYTQKEKIDPNELAAITKTWQALKTDVAKSIFAKAVGLDGLYEFIIRRHRLKLAGDYIQNATANSKLKTVTIDDAQYLILYFNYRGDRSLSWRKNVPIYVARVEGEKYTIIGEFLGETLELSKKDDILSAKVTYHYGVADHDETTHQLKNGLFNNFNPDSQGDVFK